jgi:hypothetical protein
MLKAPSGLGADLIYRMSDCILPFGCFLGFNAGDNFSNTLIDDGSANDLVFAGAAAAPFTGGWFPMFNSSAWVGPDPVGQLSNYNGLGTLGDWQVFVADVAANDTGSLNAWSLIVTPMSFSCCQWDTDPDVDAVGSTCDNCPDAYNPLQDDGDADGAGNACDCAPTDGGAYQVPAEVADLALGADQTTVTWSSAAPGAGSFTVHDVLSGEIDELPVGSSGLESCLGAGILDTSLMDFSTPALGRGFWYLTRGRNVCGVGTYGTRSDGVERDTFTCP